MKINIKASKITLVPELKALIEDKFSILDKYYDRILSIEIELGVDVAGQRKGNIYFCEGNVNVPGKLLRYRKSFSDLTKAINSVHRGLQQELSKEKEKNKKK